MPRLSIIPALEWVFAGLLLWGTYCLASRVGEFEAASIEAPAREDMRRVADSVDRFLAAAAARGGLADIQENYQRLLRTGLNRYGLVYVMDDSTRFVAHPLDETRSLLELGEAFGDNTLVRLSRDVIAGRPLDGDYRHTNTVTGQRCNEALLRLDSSGLILGLSVYDGEALESAEYQTVLRRHYIALIFLYGALFILLCGMIQRYTRCRGLVVAACPFILTAMVVCVIAAYNRCPQQDGVRTGAGFFIRQILGGREQSARTLAAKWDFKRLICQNSLDAFVNKYQRVSERMYGEPARIIPTGVYIHSADFVNPYTIRVVGTLWQKYLADGGGGLDYVDDGYGKKGALFPGAAVWLMEKTDEIETTIAGHPARLHRWNFDVEVAQKLSHSLYPFGKNEIALPIWSNDLDDNVILTPDMESYKQTYPTDNPGLGGGFHLKRWNVGGSYYTYSAESYLCNFGNAAIRGINEFPELVFKVSISRRFMDILIGKIVPLMVVLLLLFTIVFVRVTSDGFNNIIGCSGLFFVLMLDHINLRDGVSSDEIMYLEYCYFFAYALLLLIAATSFDVFRRGEAYNVKIDAMIKRAFWIFVTGAMAVVTGVYFW